MGAKAMSRQVMKEYKIDTNHVKRYSTLLVTKIKLLFLPRTIQSIETFIVLNIGDLSPCKHSHFVGQGISSFSPFGEQSSNTVSRCKCVYPLMPPQFQGNSWGNNQMKDQKYAYYVSYKHTHII